MTAHPRPGIEALWAQDGAGARALAPLSWLFGAATALRNRAYDRGVLTARPLGLPAISVGNLTVGGTGKTPMAAWVAQRLIERGLRPAILLRGYGADEPLVHERLTPGAIVVADPDRVRGAAVAIARGAEVLVLDDAFQHRRARRDLDIVLVAAEQAGSRRLLPAGPYREPESSLRRAHALVVTRKRASKDEAAATAAGWARAYPSCVVAVASLAPADLARVGGSEREPLTALRGRSVLAISAIGLPAAFEGQLSDLGARVTSAAFADHHAFSDADVTRLATRAASVDRVVCTLKDAVKLEGRWPRQGPALWYLSQAVTIERGAGELDLLLARSVPVRR
ncbi:MAG: tetraacyldisaccharide 4'-kinase [Gemmatimonadetes bacterium]|nr:tetraacyldisaccharide 4'-kinase [Gemmatimonadota bacterium]